MVSPVVPVIDILLAEKTLLNPWGTPRTDCDMTTGSKKDVSALVGANQALVQQLILRTAYHAITSDDALTASELKDWSRTKDATCIAWLWPVCSRPHFCSALHRFGSGQRSRGFYERSGS